MTLQVEHELHTRRFSRNAGLGISLILFVGLVYGLTIAKLGDQVSASKAARAEAGAAASTEAGQ